MSIFLFLTELTGSKWTPLCPEVSGSEEFHHWVTTGYWSQRKVFGDLAILEAG